jgi:transcriptional regulator with XRE-family HTH domain
MPTSSGRKMATLRARWLGHRMRELRDQNGLTLRQAAKYLQRDFSALSRFETAEWPFPRADVLQLLDLYGVTDEKQRGLLVHLSEDVWRKDEWETAFGDTLRDRSFCDVPWLEERADEIITFDVTFVPGLLQIREYADAVIRAVEGTPATGKVADWVARRLARQRIFAPPRPTRMIAVLDEAVLRRPVGGAQVMRRQLAHLQQCAARPNLSIRVIPFAAGPHAGFDGPFILFRMPPPYPEVAYVESLAGRLFLESPKTSRFVHAYDRLCETALPERESAEFIALIAEELACSPTSTGTSAHAAAAAAPNASRPARSGTAAAGSPSGTAGVPRARSSSTAAPSGTPSSPA